jgi:hypothetical protein
MWKYGFLASKDVTEKKSVFLHKLFDIFAEYLHECYIQTDSIDTELAYRIRLSMSPQGM